MEYSALVFDDCKEVEDTYDKLLATIDLFANDENCTQIVVSCKSVWTLRLASSPKNKVMLVQRSGLSRHSVQATFCRRS